CCLLPIDDANNPGPYKDSPEKRYATLPDKSWLRLFPHRQKTDRKNANLDESTFDISGRIRRHHSYHFQIFVRSCCILYQPQLKPNIPILLDLILNTHSI